MSLEWAIWRPEWVVSGFNGGGKSSPLEVLYSRPNLLFTAV